MSDLCDAVVDADLGRLYRTLGILEVYPESERCFIEALNVGESLARKYGDVCYPLMGLGVSASVNFIQRGGPESVDVFYRGVVRGIGRELRVETRVEDEVVFRARVAKEGFRKILQVEEYGEMVLDGVAIVL